MSPSLTMYWRLVGYKTTVAGPFERIWVVNVMSWSPVSDVWIHGRFPTVELCGAIVVVLAFD